MASNRPAKGGIVDDKTRLELYRVMVLSRTYEEAILREYHADKKPAFDIGAGLVAGEMHLSAVQEPAGALSPKGCRQRPGRRSRSSGREAAGWRSRSLARGPPTRAHSTSH